MRRIRLVHSKFEPRPVCMWGVVGGKRKGRAGWFLLKYLWLREKNIKRERERKSEYMPKVLGSFSL